VKDGHLDTLWLEERKLTNILTQPVRGIVGTLLSLAGFMLLWYIFMDPRGPLSWYTPQYGYMYIRWLLIVAIWQAYIFNFWPLKCTWMVGSHPLVKGAVLVGINFAVTAIVIWGFFYSVLGKLAIPYLSWPELHKLGMTDFFAREYSSLAVLMFAAIASWLSPIWPSAFENYPWHGITQPAKGLTVFAFTGLLTTYAFLVFMHPHYDVLFYPWQSFAAAYPWWYETAHTLSGNFNVGWIMCGTAAVWLVETTFEKYPFILIKKQPLRGIVGFLWILFIAFLLFYTFIFMQDVVWGESIEGAKRLMAPDWRYLHTGELAVMVLAIALTLYFYFDNWPRKFSTEVNILIRLLIILVSSVAFHYVYYAGSPALLGTQAGYSHPQQFPMAPVILWIVVMLYHNWFMDGWPGKSIQQTEQKVQVESNNKITA
jgi:AAT family amino acid transporter